MAETRVPIHRDAPILDDAVQHAPNSRELHGCTAEPGCTIRSRSAVVPNLDQMSADPVVLVDIDDGIATITLNRPAARNALDPALAAAFPEAIIECDER